MSENKQPLTTLSDRCADIGPFVPAPDDDMIVCRCEEVTKGEIRRAVHDGLWTIAEIRRYLRCGMGLCQGQTCAKLVKGIVARELHVSPALLYRRRRERKRHLQKPERKRKIWTNCWKGMQAV